MVRRGSITRRKGRTSALREGNNATRMWAAYDQDVSGVRRRRLPGINGVAFISEHKDCDEQSA